MRPKPTGRKCRSIPSCNDPPQGIRDVRILRFRSPGNLGEFQHHVQILPPLIHQVGDKVICGQGISRRQLQVAPGRLIGLVDLAVRIQHDPKPRVGAGILSVLLDHHGELRLGLRQLFLHHVKKFQGCIIYKDDPAAKEQEKNISELYLIPMEYCSTDRKINMALFCKSGSRDMHFVFFVPIFRIDTD